MVRLEIGPVDSRKQGGGGGAGCRGEKDTFPCRRAAAGFGSPAEVSVFATCTSQTQNVGVGGLDESRLHRQRSESGRGGFKKVPRNVQGLLYQCTTAPLMARLRGRVSDPDTCKG